MLVSLLTYEKDIQATQKLLAWIEELGGCKHHDLLIVADAGTPFDKAAAALRAGRSAFREAQIISNSQSVQGWPAGCWSLFQTAIHNVKEPFLILEPDAIPLRKGWLNAIEAEYHRSGKAFMGHIYDCHQAFLPPRLMSGIAVYPADTGKRFPAIHEAQHWDVYGAEIMTRDGADTPLIRHFFGEKEQPPAFVKQRHANSPAHLLEIAKIPPDCVLWHRDKTHSLIRLLSDVPKIVVCFNVHGGDIELAVQHSAWLAKMGHRNQHRAIICCDPSCPVVPLNQFEANLRRVFAGVDSFVYARPPSGYPQAANFAFQSVAHHMATQRQPWLFFEADAIALKPDWLEQLQEEYETGNASWMGPVVPHMNHMNGMSVYPADAALRMPRAMTCSAQAWDMEMIDDIHDDRHDCSRIFFHVWTLVNRMPCPVGGGEVPANITAEELKRWLPRESVLLHRVKDNSVLRVLLSGFQL